MVKSFKAFLVTIAVVSASFQLPSMGAATVTASKNYVDMKTKVEVVTNAEVGVAGYTVGTNTNCVFASTNYVDSKLGKIKTYSITDGTNTIDAARNVWEMYEGNTNASSWSYNTNPEGVNIFNYGLYIYWNDGTTGDSVIGWKIDNGDYHLGTNTALSRVEYAGAYWDEASQSPKEVQVVATRNIPVGLVCVGKLALTNEIPPAVTVVAPSTNATAGTAADARATGAALYTGFTEWEFSGNTMAGRVYTIEIISGDEPVYVLYEDGVMVSGVMTNSMDELTIVYDSVGITATRHLITPTKTSQLVNDGSNGVPFAVISQIPAPVDISGKLDGAAAYPAWLNIAEYAVGDVVSYNGGLFRCRNTGGQGIKPTGDEYSAMVWEDTTIKTLFAEKEDLTNKVTSITAQSTDAQYPSAKCVYDRFNQNVVSVGAGAGIGASPVQTVNYAVAVGNSANVRANNTVAIGPSAKANAGNGIAIGSGAKANAANAVQIGYGTNNNAHSLQFEDYTVLDSDGHVPDARVPELLSKVSTNALAGQIYDFSRNYDIIRATADIVRLLGGTVTNNPTANQGGN